MMETETTLTCNKIGCTLAQTGKCVLDHDPEHCLERIDSLRFQNTAEELSETIPAPKEPLARFNSSYTLSLAQTENLMSSKYCRLIGILGAPGTGKTACLVSSYLMMAHRRFTGFDFRDSKTLMAFEDISRGARIWNVGDSPENLTTHTELPDERTAGFLHLRLYKKKSNKCFDFLIPDLPGEWTTSLIDLNRHDRLGFLKSCETIWLMVNGQDIQKTTTRHSTLHRLTLLIQRLSEFLEGSKPPLVLVVTHKDKFTSVGQLLQKAIDCATKYNFPVSVNEIASFSENTKIPPGHGISKLIEALIVEKKQTSPELLPPIYNDEPGIRQFMNFGKI